MSKQPYIILKDAVSESDRLEQKVNELIAEGYIPAADLVVVPQPIGSQLIIAMMYAPAEAQMVMAMCEESQNKPPFPTHWPDRKTETGRTNEGNVAGSCLCSDGSCSSFTSGDEGKNEP